MVGGKLVLSWVVEEEMFFFKLSSMTKGYVGLAFSYNDLPLDGFIAGVDNEGDDYVLDLHLDYAGDIRWNWKKKKIFLFDFRSCE